MAQRPNSPPTTPPTPDQAQSGGERTPAGSNYGDWRPASPDKDKNAVPPGSTPQSGVVPSTAPSGIGSTPHK